MERKLKDMTQISVTENENNKNNLYYVQSSLAEIFSQAGCSVNVIETDKRCILNINCPEQYKDIIKMEVGDKIAEVIAIRYKNDFFKKTISIEGLSKVEREILVAGLIAADLEEDKKYAFDRVKNQENIAIDGVYNFRLKQLKKKWVEITQYIPSCFLNSQLKDFIGFLLENKKKRVYVESGRVYDSHYRRLKRSLLLDGEGALITREILLSNCGEIRLSGSLPKEDEYYIKEFYNDKIVFFGNSYS